MRSADLLAECMVGNDPAAGILHVSARNGEDSTDVNARHGSSNYEMCVLRTASVSVPFDSCDNFHAVKERSCESTESISLSE